MTKTKTMTITKTKTTTNCRRVAPALGGTLKDNPGLLVVRSRARPRASVGKDRHGCEVSFGVWQGPGQQDDDLRCPALLSRIVEFVGKQRQNEMF